MTVSVLTYSVILKIILYVLLSSSVLFAFSALTLLIRQQEVKNRAVGCWHGYLERDADLHMAQRIPLPLTVSCFSKIQIGFTFLVPAHPGSLGQRAVKWVCVIVIDISYLIRHR